MEYVCYSPEENIIPKLPFSINELTTGQHVKYKKLSHFHITLQPSTTVQVDK